jgi:ABC-2 type transport system ATP-binding protein
MEPGEAKRHLGYLPEQPPLYDEMTVREYLRFVAALKGVAARAIPAHVDEVMELTGLTSMQSRLLGHLSKGFRQRAGMAQALCGDPDVLVLDEPTVGLDPEHRRYIWNHLEALAAQGCAIVVTTHVMDEAERCARIAMIREGRLIADASPADILARTGTNTLEDAFLALEESESPDTAAEPNVSPSLGEKEACHD